MLILSHWCDTTPRPKREPNPSSSALKADALTTRPTRRFAKTNLHAATLRSKSQSYPSQAQKASSTHNIGSGSKGTQDDPHCDDHHGDVLARLVPGDTTSTHSLSGQNLDTHSNRQHTAQSQLIQYLQKHKISSTVSFKTIFGNRRNKKASLPVS